jgi:hypothetical protein
MRSLEPSDKPIRALRVLVDDQGHRKPVSRNGASRHSGHVVAVTGGDELNTDQSKIHCEFPEFPRAILHSTFNIDYSYPCGVCPPHLLDHLFECLVGQIFATAVPE